MALLQRVTGIIHEEKIMQKLLQLHPAYVPTIKKMPAITGSTADPYVKDEVMAHLRRGLEATGLLDEFEGDATSPGGRGSRASALARSFTRKRKAEKKAERARADEKKDKDYRRASLAQVAMSNKAQRDMIESIQKQEESMPRRLSGVGALVATANSFVDRARRRSQDFDESFKTNEDDDPLAA